MRALGFETLLKDRWLSPIIVTFFCPADPAFVFTRFYDLMKAKGFIIYPGKLDRSGQLSHRGDRPYGRTRDAPRRRRRQGMPR